MVKPAIQPKKKYTNESQAPPLSSAVAVSLCSSFQKAVNNTNNVENPQLIESLKDHF